MGIPSWPKRVRAFLSDLFGSSLVAHLRQELVQAKVERDRVIVDLRAENRELLNRLLAANRITPLIAPTDQTKKPSVGPTRWEQMQAKAIAENAKAEAEELAQSKAKEN